MWPCTLVYEHVHVYLQLYALVRLFMWCVYNVDCKILCRVRDYSWQSPKYSIAEQNCGAAGPFRLLHHSPPPTPHPHLLEQQSDSIENSNKVSDQIINKNNQDASYFTNPSLIADEVLTAPRSIALIFSIDIAMGKPSLAVLCCKDAPSSSANSFFSK